MNELTTSFANDETGAVTVDWVLLTAAIVGLTISVMATVSNGLENLSGDVENQMTTQGISTTF